MTSRLLEEDLVRRMALVTSAGRSGSTWIGKMLDSSPDVLYKHEPDNRRFFDLFAGIPSRVDPGCSDSRLAEAYIAAAKRTVRTYSPDLHPQPVFRKHFQSKAGWEALDRAGRMIKKVTPKSGRRMSLPVPRWLFNARVTQCRLVFKTVVSNLRLAWILEILPDARAALLIRHPGGYLNSWLNGVRKRGWTGFGARSRLDATLLPFRHASHERKYLDAYLHGSDFERELIYWSVANESPLIDQPEGDRLRVFVYEDFCRNPADTFRELFSHLGVPWCDNVETFLISTNSEHRDGYHDFYKNPRVTVDAWKRELDRAQFAIVDRILADSELARFW